MSAFRDSLKPAILRVIGLLNKPAGSLTRFPKAKDAVLRAMGRAHAALYRRTGGRIGGTFGAPALLLTVRGRKSGTLHTTPLYYIRDGRRFAVAGSNGGDPRTPQWFKNLMAAQTAQVQVDAEVVDVSPHIAKADERARLWNTLVGAWPSFSGYQRHTDREIPIVVLEPQADQTIG